MFCMRQFLCHIIQKKSVLLRAFCHITCKKSAVLKHTLLTIASPSFAVHLRPSLHIVFIAASILWSTLCRLLPVTSCMPCIAWRCMTFAVIHCLPSLAAQSKLLSIHCCWTFVVAWHSLSLNAWRSVVAKVRVIFSGKFSWVMPMMVRAICEICLSNVDDGGEGWEGILMMHKGVRWCCLVVVRAMSNIHLNVIDEGGKGGGGVEVMHGGGIVFPFVIVNDICSIASDGGPLGKLKFSRCMLLCYWN